MPGGGKKGGKGGNQGGKGNGEQFKFDFGANPEKMKETTAALMPVLQSKLDTLIGKSSGYLETLPKSVQGRIRALKKLYDRQNAIEEEFKKERDALEAKYEAMKVPLFNRRSEIVNGKSEPTAEELAGEENKDVKTETTDKKEEDVKGIPGFWLEALKHTEDFAEMITENDEPVLKHLTDIKYTTTGGPSFDIEFVFSPNDYFENTSITKKYILSEDPQFHDTMFDHAEATEIQWKAGKNITVRTVTKKKSGKGKKGKGGPAKTVTVEEPTDSFFNFFKNMEEEFEDEEELEEYMENDYELGVILKTQIIPMAVLWFTGEVPMFGGEGFDGEEFDDDEEDDDDEGVARLGDGGDDDSENDEDFDPSKAPPPQQECKQQ